MRASADGNEWLSCLEKIKSTASFIIFLGSDYGWRIQGVSSSAAGLLGCDLAAMRAGAVSLNNYVEDVSALVAILRAKGDDTTVFSLRNVVTADNSEEKGFSSAVAVVGRLQVSAAVCTLPTDPPRHVLFPYPHTLPHPPRSWSRSHTCPAH